MVKSITAGTKRGAPGEARYLPGWVTLSRKDRAGVSKK